MSLDVRRLEKVRERAGGIVQARCPACAAEGGDRAGEHLRIYPDGRFGCCVHPKDSEHRKSIFALAGDKTPRSFSVKVGVHKPVSHPAQSVAASLVDFGRTLRTAVSGSVSSEVKASQAPTAGESLGELTFRTVRTPLSIPYAYARKAEHIRCDDTHTYKETKEGVLSVLPAEDWKRRHPNVPIDCHGRPLPYLGRDGRLVIPFDSDVRFHYWNGGQELERTMDEVKRGLEKEHDATGV